MILSLIEPNLHPTLVHYPIALLTLGVIIELFAALWRRSSVRTAGRWMIVLGTLAAIPAVTTGLYALRQTANPAAAPTAFWYQITQGSSWSPKHWETLIEHLRLTAAAAAILLISVATWLGSSDRARPRIYLLGMAILLLCLILVGMGSHEGGELVYDHGTGVALTPTAVPIVESPTSEDSADSWIDPAELHLLLAGLTIAVVAMTVGISVRRSAIAWENEMAETKAAAAGLRPAAQDDRNFLQIPTLYPGRFWLISGILALGTLTAGIWILGLWEPSAFYNYLSQKQDNDELRPVLHGIFGLTILTLIIILGVLSRWFPRRRFFMGVLTTLLLLAVTAQVWSGVLMLFDSTSGPVTRFNRAPKIRNLSGIRPIAPATTQSSTQPATQATGFPAVP